MKRMAISKVLKLPSIDGIDETAYQVINNDYYVEHMKQKKYLRLRKAMIAGDYPPIHIATGSVMIESYSDMGSPIDPKLADTRMMGNGHHRLRIAWELGWKTIKYSSDVHDTEWGI
jgi:hypothetical protein